MVKSVGAVIGADAGDVLGSVICPTASDFSDAETKRTSSEILFKVTVISSTFTKAD